MFPFRKKQTPNLTPRETLLDETTPFFLTEAYRNLKASISLSIPKKTDGKAVSFFITSALPNEGKSFVSANLALMFARSNVKVLLIDADMRRGTMQQYFSLKRKPGLSELISGAATLEEVIHSAAGHENLSVITAGTGTPNPYELLGSQSMADIYGELSARFDYIIFDTSPLGMMADCLALVPYVDGCAIVCEYMSSTYKDLKNVVGKLQFSGCRVLGVILNAYEESKKGLGRRAYKNYNYQYGGEDSSEN